MLSVGEASKLKLRLGLPAADHVGSRWVSSRLKLAVVSRESTGSPLSSKRAVLPADILNSCSPTNTVCTSARLSSVYYALSRVWSCLLAVLVDRCRVSLTGSVACAAIAIAPCSYASIESHRRCTTRYAGLLSIDSYKRCLGRSSLVAPNNTRFPALACTLLVMGTLDDRNAIRDEALMVNT
jgi:hypothetical protein